MESKDESKIDKSDGGSTHDKSFNFRKNKFRSNHTSEAYGNVDKSFEGVTSEIGGVLGLSSEKYVYKKVNFDKFQDLLITYIIKKIL